MKSTINNLTDKGLFNQRGKRNALRIKMNLIGMYFKGAHAKVYALYDKKSQNCCEML